MRARIALDPTGESISERPAEKQQDAKASLRENLAADLAAAQAALSANIIALRQSGAGSDIVASGEVQLATLMQLQRQLDTATPATMAAIRAEVASCIAAASKLAEQAQTAAAGGTQSVGGMSLAAASSAARATAIAFEDDYFKRKKYEAYLHFTSPDDEAEFRRREAERKLEIEKALALNTPQGTLRALTLQEAQLKDAGGHGASESPDFASDLSNLGEAKNRLGASIAADNKAKGGTDDAKSKSADPLDAIAPAPIPQKEIAALKVAGVTIAEPGAGHGVTTNASNRETSSRVPT